MFMKQLKFLMVAFTLLMGVSLTSCLSDDAGESMYDGIGYVRTVMGTYFIDPNGNTYYPTSSSVVEMEAQGFKMSEANLAYIAFKYVEDTPTTKADANTTPKTFRIKLVSAAAVDSYQTEEAASIEDMETMVPENAPIVTLEPTDNYGQTYKPWMYGTEMLVLPVSWKMENDVFAVRNKAYDIENIMESFKAKNGSYPTTITIKAKTDVDGATLPESYTDYSISLNWSTQSKSN